jgi:hypothetical protein
MEIIHESLRKLDNFGGGCLLHKTCWLLVLLPLEHLEMGENIKINGIKNLQNQNLEKEY